MWIYEEPQILFFSLQRVKFDHLQQKVVKSQDYFSFEKVIYADMFLYKNHQKANEARQKIESTKEKVKNISEKLRSYQSYQNNAQVSLDTQIKNVEGYLTKSLDKQELVSETDLQKAIQVLKVYQKSVSMK